MLTSPAIVVSRVFRTQTDSGSTSFNYSRMLGASSTVAISSLYYEQHRDATNASVGFGVRLGGAIAANILKEFWPDFQKSYGTPAAQYPGFGRGSLEDERIVRNRARADSVE